jgi:hypothetical protein
VSVELQSRFESYDRENPAIWEKFVHFAVELIDAGVDRAGAKFIVERIRWETKVRAKELGVNARFKINNNYPAYYARKLIQKDPARFANFFETRDRAAS